jgi:hypothetical protein
MGVFSQSIGTLIYAINKVTAQQGSSQRTVTRGSSIFTGDTIITGADSRAQIKYTNGTLVSIQPNSRYQTLAYGAKSQMKSKLSTGAIEYNSKGKKKAVVQTPVVALAILGTHFRVMVQGNKTFVQVFEGLIMGNNTLLGPGQAFSSGSFDSNGNFTPGSIPWLNTGEQTTSGIDVVNNNTVIEITEIIPTAIFDATNGAVIDAVVAATTLAQLELIYPPI